MFKSSRVTLLDFRINKQACRERQYMYVHTYALIWCAKCNCIEMHYGKNEVLTEYRLEIKYVKLKTLTKKMIANQR